MTIKHKPDRRQALKIITIGGVATTLLVPTNWVKPVVEAIIVPAHAAASPKGTTTSSTTSGTSSTSTTSSTTSSTSSTPAP